MGEIAVPISLSGTNSQQAFQLETAPMTLNDLQLSFQLITTSWRIVVSVGRLVVWWLFYCM